MEKKIYSEVKQFVNYTDTEVEERKSSTLKQVATTWELCTSNAASP